MQRDAVANEASFQDELGQFSEGQFMQVLTNAGFSEQDYLKAQHNIAYIHYNGHYSAK